MFTPFWNNHDDSGACSNKKEFENYGFSDIFSPPSLLYRPLAYCSTRRFIIKSPLYLYLLFIKGFQVSTESPGTLGHACYNSGSLITSARQGQINNNNREV